MVRFLASPMASKVAPMVDNSRVEVGRYLGDPREMPKNLPVLFVRFGYVISYVYICFSIQTDFILFHLGIHGIIVAYCESQSPLFT